MGIFDFIGNAAGVKAMQSGSDVFIQRYTKLVTFDLPSPWRSHANDVIKARFLNQQDIRSEFDAALLKLAVFWLHANQNDELLAAHVAIAIRELREAAHGRITPSISLEVTAHTGQ